MKHFVVALPVPLGDRLAVTGTDILLATLYAAKDGYWDNQARMTLGGTTWEVGFFPFENAKPGEIFQPKIGVTVTAGKPNNTQIDPLERYVQVFVVNGKSSHLVMPFQISAEVTRFQDKLAKQFELNLYHSEDTVVVEFWYEGKWYQATHLIKKLTRVTLPNGTVYSVFNEPRTGFRLEKFGNKFVHPYQNRPAKEIARMMHAPLAILSPDQRPEPEEESPEDELL